MRKQVLLLLLLALGSSCTMAPAPVAGEPIPDLPDFSPATRTKYEVLTGKDGYARTVKTEFASDATLDAVKAHYKAAFASGGWQVTSSQETGTEAEYRLSKGAAVAEVEIDQKKAGGVEIKVVRKDR
jgi:hypothetical protein